MGKSWTFYLARRGYQPRYIPEQVIRLILGPTFAIVLFFVVNVEIFGIKVTIPEEEQFYAYSIVAFIAGYFTKYVIDTLSNMARAVIRAKEPEPEAPEAREERHGKKDKGGDTDDQT